jgi:LacI family transcriptional regulator, repressor for deo operon, udp, cdd, tsx, nupC, and nupG
MYSSTHRSNREPSLVTRKQVAEKAGVSVAAVSRVLNNSGYVSQAKREAVLTVVKELGYEPNPIAVSLKSNRTHQLLFYVRDISNNYYMEMYKGMLEYAGTHGYMFIVSGGFSYDQIRSLMVDGVLLPSQDFTSTEYVGNLHVPVAAVTYGDGIDDGIVHIEVNVGMAMGIAIQYLRSMGHTRIAYLSKNRIDDRDPRQRAYKESMSTVFTTDIDSYIFGPTTYPKAIDEVQHFDIGIAAAKAYLESGVQVSAIACFNDDMAMGLISYLQTHGVMVPRDVSVIGIDGHLGSAYTSPPLTTVSISPRAHGIECARVLIGLVERQADIVPRPVEIRLIERESVRRV